MALFKRIIGNDERKRHRWGSGDLEKGQRRQFERENAKRVLEFKERMARRGIAFRTGTDAWEAFWTENPNADRDFGGQSADKALADKARQNFEHYWQRLHKPQTVRSEGDGIIAASAPTLYAIGTGKDSMQADPVNLLLITDPEQRALATNRLIRTVERRRKKEATHIEHTNYLESLIPGLQGNATVRIDPNTGERIIQGLLAERIEEVEDDDE